MGMNEERLRYYQAWVMGYLVWRKLQWRSAYTGTKKHPIKGRQLGRFLKERFTRFNY